MIAPLCAKQGVLLPFVAVTLNDNPGTSRTIPIQVTNLSNNFVTFWEDCPLGTIEEVHEVLAEDDDVEGEELPSPSDANPSDPQVRHDMAYNVRNCSPSAAADGAGSKSAPSPEDVQEDVSYPSFPTDMKDAQEWLLDVQSRMSEHMKEMYFHAINAVTQKDSFPLPLIEEYLDALEGVQYMSTLDMNSGYFQFAMALADRCKTAFLTKYGLFEFT